MKHATFSRILALLLALTFVGLMFVGCTRNDTEQPSAAETTPSTPTEETGEKGFCTVVIEGEPATEYRVNLDKVTGTDGLLSVLAYLKTEKSLAYTEEYGFLTEVGSVKQDADAGKYVYIWTSVEKDFDVSAYASTKTYSELTLTSTGVGAKDMTITDGATIYIGLYTWS